MKFTRYCDLENHEHDMWVCENCDPPYEDPEYLDCTTDPTKECDMCGICGYDGDEEENYYDEEDDNDGEEE